MYDDFESYSIDPSPKHPKHPEAPEHNEHQYCVLAEARIADQPYQNTFCPEEALKKGTLFADLYRPYKSRGVKI